MGLSAPESTTPNNALVAINTLPFPRHEIVKTLPRHGQPSFAYISPYSDSTNGTAPAIGLCEVAPIPSFAPFTSPFKSSAVTLTVLHSGQYIIENAHYTVKFDNGTIPSLYSKLLDRELVPQGKRMNQLVLYDDKPLYWQAWDVEVFHLRSRRELTPTSTMISEHGPMRVAISTCWKISDDSWAKTTLSVTGVPLATENSAFNIETPTVPIEVSAEVEWHEDKKFLKAEFPTTLTPLHSQFISETQYGLVSRPTHRNTSWDAAKFEVVGHRFSVLHEACDGLAVLNDSKYGFAAEGSLMRLSVLRAPKAPDGHADMGRQYCRWAILPFSMKATSGGISRVVQAARAFNNPISIPTSNGIGRPEEGSSFEVDESRRSVGLRHVPAIEPRSNKGGRGNRGTPAIFPFTNIRDYIFAAKHEELPSLARLLSSVTLHQDGEHNLVLDTIKRGEDDADLAFEGCLFSPKDEKSIVVRVYEATGQRSGGQILMDSSLFAKNVYKCNLLEDQESAVSIHDKGSCLSAEITLRAFEVATYKIVL